MKSGANYKITRRTFFKTVAFLSVLSAAVTSCKEKVVSFYFRKTMTNYSLGHRLWLKDFPEVTEVSHIKYVIVGGGISGLSAARQFVKKGIQDFMMLELEDHLGGNSSNGENQYSKYPLGAHYLPIPNKEDKELLQFLEEEKIIVGYKNDQPVFDEEQLSFSPQERLFYKNTWVEGLIPKIGIATKDEQDIERFFEKVEAFKKAKDEKGNYWFDIPLKKASKEAEVLVFDTFTMKEWLQKESLTSEVLFQYVDYCCRDDYGLGAEHISAWAGIHYFSGRKHDFPGYEDNVLTWPEGNARLASLLKKYVEKKHLTKHIVYNVQVQNDKVELSVFDAEKNSSKKIIAEKVIVATPQYVNQYLFQDRKPFTKDFNYAPWVLATFTVNHLFDNNSYPLSWDNVIYGAKGLGYIYDQQQSLVQMQDKKVITYYLSLADGNTLKSRKSLREKDQEYWKNYILEDLKVPHPTIEDYIEEVHLHYIGHGMISPVPHFIFGSSKQKAAQTIANKIFFAHSDLSGISIFEEAFHQGIDSVNSILHDTTLDS
jgi:protoporphyrinogen oxidase